MPTKEGPKVTYPTGATRNEVPFAFHLVSGVGLRRLAETMAEGEAKYGTDNWKKGFPIPDLLNHSIAHIYAYLEGDRSEDHLAHAAFGLFAGMHFEEKPATAGGGTIPVDDLRKFSGKYHYEPE